MAGAGSGIQYRRHADATTTATGRKIYVVVGERYQARAAIHTGDQSGRSGRDKCDDQRASECRIQNRVYLEYTAERSHHQRHVLSR